MAHLYKSRLQNYAQKRNIPFPTYACEMQGPPHARLFKARVTIDGVTFEGPEFCSTLKDAEHAAAKVAMTTLSPDGTQEDDCLFKSLLQELAQKKGLLLPVYATNRTGPSHLPSFACTVEINGECYVGEEARTKKQAEMNAAKVAYSALTGDNKIGVPKANNAAVFSDIPFVGPSSFGSLSLGTNATVKKESTTLAPNTSKMQTINGQIGYPVTKESDKSKGLYWMSKTPSEDTVTLSPVVIHQSQPKADPTITTQAREGAGLNGKKAQPLINFSASNAVMESGAAKIVIRPHMQGMTYDGPIQVSDDEWVAMKVDV